MLQLIFAALWTSAAGKRRKRSPTDDADDYYDGYYGQIGDDVIAKARKKVLMVTPVTDLSAAIVDFLRSSDELYSTIEDPADLSALEEIIAAVEGGNANSNDAASDAGGCEARLACEVASGRLLRGGRKQIDLVAK